MVNAKDLMIGDWVQYGNLIDEYGYVPQGRVSKLTHYATLDEQYEPRIQIEMPDGFQYCNSIEEQFYPIPLTPEILEKNGFDREDNFFGKTCYAILKHDTKVMVFVIPNEYYWLEVNITQKYTMLYGLKMRVKFVHELQHALKLCGIKKEIVL